MKPTTATTATTTTTTVSTVSTATTRLVLAHFWVAVTAFALGSLMGVMQALARAGVELPFGSASLYYMSVTAHGLRGARLTAAGHVCQQTRRPRRSTVDMNVPRIHVSGAGLTTTRYTAELPTEVEDARRRRAR